MRNLKFGFGINRAFLYHKLQFFAHYRTQQGCDSHTYCLNILLIVLRRSLPTTRTFYTRKKNQIGKKDAINSYGRHAKSYYWAHDVLMLYRQHSSSIEVSSWSWIECQKSNLSNNACWAFEHFIIFIYLWFYFGQPHYIGWVLSIFMAALFHAAVTVRILVTIWVILKRTLACNKDWL